MSAPEPVLNAVAGAAPDLAAQMDAIGRAARAAALRMALAEPAAKALALRTAAQVLRDRAEPIIAANQRDCASPTAQALSPALRDRLLLDRARIEAMATGLETVAALPDPVGTELAAWQRPNGLRIRRVRVPIGVIGVIYESRPNVTADAGGLCLKAGNATILRGGSESFHSAAAIVAALHDGLAQAGLPRDAVQSVPTRDRAAVGLMLQMAEHIDVIVPRGGASLVERVMAESRVPVFAHLQGVCHTYLHQAADPAMAVALTVNGKMRRTGICGATETVLVDRTVASALLPPVLGALIAAGCEIRGDAETRRIEPRALPATEADWTAEYLDAIVAVRVVDGLAAAIDHINRYGSHHTDAIVTADAAAARRFQAEVDSGIVLHNASTQFADGGEFGMGAEIGIATGKLHARGPVGAEQLTSYKYLVDGNGQVRP